MPRMRTAALPAVVAAVTADLATLKALMED